MAAVPQRVKDARGQGERMLIAGAPPRPVSEAEDSPVVARRVEAVGAREYGGIPVSASRCSRTELPAGTVVPASSAPSWATRRVRHPPKVSDDECPRRVCASSLLNRATLPRSHATVPGRPLCAAGTT
jgi:hypothetical protein